MSIRHRIISMMVFLALPWHPLCAQELQDFKPFYVIYSPSKSTGKISLRFSGDGLTNQIQVRKFKDKAILQILDFKPPEDYLSEGKAAVEIGDFNFDGYRDFAIMNYRGGTGNTGYEYFLFNPSTNQFENPESFSHLCSPIFFPKTKIITSYSKGGGAGAIYQFEKYLVNGFALELQSRIEQGPDPENQDYLIKQRWERKGGELVLTSQTRRKWEN